MSLSNLAQPMGGLFLFERALHDVADAPQLETWTVSCGDLATLLPYQNGLKGGPRFHGQMAGSGTSWNREEALLCARAEALERYSSAAFIDDQFIRAAADELGASCLPVETLPLCSTTEFADPLCPLVRPDGTKTIRWVEGLSLSDGRTVLLPAVLVYLYAGFESDQEKIANPISTGCAAHTSYEAALVSAILEVIERDAVSLIWLQQLTLPEIFIDGTSGPLQIYKERMDRASSQIEFRFYDATLDIKVPIVYGIQRSHLSKNQHTLVSCSAAATPEMALIKVMRDMTAVRLASRVRKQLPASPAEFSDVMDGAHYMARPEHAEAFDFLLNSKDRTTLEQMAALEAATPRDQLQELLALLKAADLEAFAVDLTTDEATRAGMTVVKVVIPSLQPLSFQARARYLGHPRLYELPRKLGREVKAEAALNQWPQPFG